MAIHEQIHLLEYWRNTLADGSRVAIPVDKSIHQYNVAIDYTKGYIAAAQATALLDAAEHQQNEIKGRLNKDAPDWEKLEETNVLIAPFSISPNTEYTKYPGETGISYPFWVRAILNRKGSLNPYEEAFPYIPRVHLEPQINETVNFIFSDVDKVDEAFATPFASDGNWADYWAYLLRSFVQITGVQLHKYAPENYTVNFTNTLVAHENLTAAADGIIKLYDYLIKGKEVPTLLAGLADRNYTALRPLLTMDDFEETSADHLGQMAYAYPLSISQRKTLYHFQTLQKGEVLAVNGPPGTGKTTLLQSVVANEVVQSALKGGEPSVILACSTNNQAVTNIIDSFSSIIPKPGLLYERWLPDLQGFGLYLPSQDKPVTKNIPYLKRIAGRLTGAPIYKENNQYLAVAEQQFITKAERYLEQNDLTVSDIIQKLQAVLKHKQEKLKEGVKIWQKYKAIPSLLQKLGLDTTATLFPGHELDETALEHIESNIRQIETKVSNNLDQEPFWIKLLSFLSLVKDKRASRLKQIFRDCPISYDVIDFYKITSFHHFFDEKLKLIQQIRKFAQTWTHWKQNSNIKSNPPINDGGFKTAERQKQSFFYDELEMGLKYDLFYLAVHYWEGRWIMATQDLILRDRIHRNGKADAKNAGNALLC